MKRTIKFLIILEGAVLISSLFSFTFFINLQVAFLSSFFILLGSAYAYRRAVINEADAQNIFQKRDLVDTIEDPHELYEQENIDAYFDDETDIKAILKEEKKKIKTLDMGNAKRGVKAGVSFFRIVPYLFLVLGFIALQNNKELCLSIYLPSLLIGVIAGYFGAKELIKS